MFVSIAVALFIFLTFCLFAALKSTSGENKLKYPSSTDCGDIAKPFIKGWTGEDGKDPVYTEWYRNMALFDEGPTAKTRGAGLYQCYC